MTPPVGPTDPASVTPDTPWEALDLSWTEAELPQRARTRHVHGLMPYLGKFSPQVAEVFLRKLLRPGQTVLDPFAGSGTTLVQANELGVHAVGIDVSEFNVKLMRVKCAPYAPDALRFALECLLEETESLLETGWAGWSSDDYLIEWYTQDSRAALLAYREAMRGATGLAVPEKWAAEVVLARAARSARLAPHFELDRPKRPYDAPYWCHKHKRECPPTGAVPGAALRFLRRYAADTVRRIGAWADVRTEARMDAVHGDARHVRVRADGILTSPPYVGLIDYHRQHEYAYRLIPMADLAGGEIGPASGGAGRQARERYQDDVVEALALGVRGLPRGGPIAVVANDRHNLYPVIQERLGVEPVAEVRRNVNRRTGLRTGGFDETIFIWRKP